MKYFIQSLFAVGVLLISYAIYEITTSSNWFTSYEKETMNHLYAMSNDELEKACEKMSRFAHARGLTDGAFIPFGRNHYYKESCLQELEHRKQVMAASVGENSKFANNKNINSVQNQKNAEFGRLMDQAIKPKAVSITVIDKTKWKIAIQVNGELGGKYQIAIDNLVGEMRDPLKNLLTEEIEIGSGKTEIVREISLQQLKTCKGCDLPEIKLFPISVSLTFLSSGQQKIPPMLTGILNSSISLQ